MIKGLVYPSLIYLVGMPSCGKSTLGQMLAPAIGYSFVDTDTLLVEKYGLKVAEFIESRGEADFRKEEAEVLKSTFEMKQTVVACGGGTPCFLDGIDQMNRNGQTIYLQIELELLVIRLAGTDENPRPLLPRGDKKLVRSELEKLFFGRKSCYEKAQTLAVIVDNIDSNLTNLLNALKKYTL